MPEANVQTGSNTIESAERAAKYEALLGVLRPLKRVAVAFSAGVDSTLVLRASIDALGAENVVAVTAKSDSLAAAEFQQSLSLAESLGARHLVVETDEFDNPSYLANPTDRCYFCKDTLYDHMQNVLEREGLSFVVNGINVDDYDDHRPGIRAAREHGVRCAPAEAGLTKSDIRDISRALNLPTFDKPASPCLSSRVQYGEEITPEKLRRIEAAEALLREMGFRECRVRHHDNLARIEIPPEEIGKLAEPEPRETVAARFRELGYQYVTLDLVGFRSGSMNEVIPLGSLQIDRKK